VAWSRPSIWLLHTMGSSPYSPASPAGSLPELLAAAVPGVPLSGELLRRLRPTGVMGELAHMPLTEILQNLDFGKKSGRVDAWPDGAEGSVHVVDGQIVRAAATTNAGAVDGENAVLELCRRSGGFFRILYAREEVERNVHRPTTFVLLEALRVIDEANGRSEANEAGDDDAWNTTTGSYATLAASVPIPPLSDEGAATGPAPTAPLKTSVSSGKAAAVTTEDASFPPLHDSLGSFDTPTLALEIDVGERPSPRAVSLPPTSPMPATGDALLDLIAEGERLVAAGDIESAKQVLSRGQGLVPRDDFVRRKLLSVNEAIDAAQANTLLDRALRGGAGAVELARRATQLRPVRDVLLRALAVFARHGEHEDVADAAEQLLELDPDDEGALRMLLDANLAQQHWGGAVRAAESLLRRCPDDPQVKEILQKASALARRR
jgi:tetratricopeptide (TPR) repeat protein